MNAPIFLNISEVLTMHARQIELFGGESGVRDLGLLESAVGMPGMGFGGEYFHKDVFEMAAAYLFHIAMNHPFVDGNKRTGLTAAIAFLVLNGFDLDEDSRELMDMVIAVTEGRMKKDDVGDYFKRHSKPVAIM